MKLEMDHLHLLVVNQAQEWASQTKPLRLCAVLASFGSASRGPGQCLSLYWLVKIEGLFPVGETKISLKGGLMVNSNR